MRINGREHILVNLTSLPPRYDVHNFPKKKKQPLPRINESAAAKTIPSVIVTERPSPPSRAVSDDSIMSFGYDLASTSSEQNMSSEPPSPTLATHPKPDAAHRLVIMSKGRPSEERAREDGLKAVSLGVGLLI
jgi:hypothetical protein